MNIRIQTILVCALACASSLFAQVSGSISGVVTDGSGASVSGAKIEL